MKINEFSLTSPKKRECEDAYFINSNAGVFGVLDGVTPLHDFKDECDHNSAYLAANLFKSHFEQLRTIDSLASEIVVANRLVKNKMIQYQVDLTVKHELWSTCIAAVHVHNETVHFAQLGDCMVLVRYEDDTIQVLTENLVSSVASRAKARREADRNIGIDLPDECYFEIPRNRWIYQRWMANSPDGYGVANGMEEVKDYIQTGTISTSGLSHILLLSDGMFFPGKSLEDTFRDVLHMGFEMYVQKLVLEEQARGLSPDDRTAILLQDI